MRRPRENRDIKKGFIWVPKRGPIITDILVSGVSVRDDVRSAVFTKVICPQMSYCNITLFNADGKYSNKYTGGETIQFLMDRGRTAKVIQVTGEAQEVTITEGTDRL